MSTCVSRGDGGERVKPGSSKTSARVVNFSITQRGKKRGKGHARDWQERRGAGGQVGFKIEEL